MTMNLARAVFAIAGVLVSASCAPSQPPEAPPAEANNGLPAHALQSLQNLEVSLIPPYPEGTARFDHLWDYFQDANPALISHLDDLIHRYHAGETHAGVTYISGPSGVGKSYVIRQLKFPEEATSTPIKLATLFHQTAPDLQTLDGAWVFNRLPTAEVVSLEPLLQSQHAADKAFVLLDDLDEIHAEAALKLLQNVDAYVRTRPRGFVHVIVFGRPESFRPWLAQVQPAGPMSPQVFLLEGPDFQTTGDVAFRCRDYYQWQHKQDTPQAVEDAVLARLDRFGFLRPSFRPLASGNFVLDSVILPTLNNTPMDTTAGQLREQLLRKLLERNQESHQRPAVDNDTYRYLLEEAAAFPLVHHRPLDGQGFFDVRGEDSLSCVDEQGRTRTVGLRALLDRSGVVLLNLKQIEKTEYRFEPVWLHATLVEGWIQRQSRTHAPDL